MYQEVGQVGYTGVWLAVPGLSGGGGHAAQGLQVLLQENAQPGVEQERRPGASQLR